MSRIPSLLFALAIVLAVAVPAQATVQDDIYETAEATATRPAPGEVEVGALQSGGSGIQSGFVSVGVSRLDGCVFSWSLAPSEIVDQLAGYAVFAPERFSSRPAPEDTQRYTMIVCPAAGGRPLFYEFWPEGDLPPERVTGFLGREAVARAVVPLPVADGAPDGIDIPFLVNLPNWWWVEDWEPVSSTAALGEPSPVSVTAVLTPTESVWAVEGYGSIRCGQGKAWHRDRGLLDTDPDRCGMTFPRHAPPEGLVQTVTVVYDVSFQCQPSALCAQLPVFEPIEVTSSTTIDIIQVRGVLLS